MLTGLFDKIAFLVWVDAGQRQRLLCVRQLGCPLDKIIVCYVQENRTHITVIAVDLMPQWVRMGYCS